MSQTELVMARNESKTRQIISKQVRIKSKQVKIKPVDKNISKCA